MGWTKQEVIQLRELYQGGYRVEDIAKRLGKSVRSVYLKAFRLGINRLKHIEEPTNVTPLPAPLKTLRGNFAVTSDWHIPYHDTHLVDSLFNTCVKQGITNIIIAGDFLNLDSCSTFLTPTCDINFELRCAEELLTSIAQVFDNVIIIPGNHELRVARTLGTPLSFERLLRMFCKQDLNVTATEFDYVDFVSGDEPWKACHPKNYSQVKGRVAYGLASKYECNTIVAHGHAFGMNLGVSGKWWCIDSGGLFDPNKIMYHQHTRLGPAPNQGFIIVKDGYPHPYTPRMGNC